VHAQVFASGDLQWLAKIACLDRLLTVFAVCVDDSGSHENKFDFPTRFKFFYDTHAADECFQFYICTALD